MIKRANLTALQILSNKQAPRAKEAIQDAIHEICELRDAMRKVNAVAFDALSEPAELRRR